MLLIFSVCLVAQSCLILQPHGPSANGIFQQEYWSRLPFPPPMDFLNAGSNLHLLHWQAYSFTTKPPGKPTVLMGMSIGIFTLENSLTVS